MAETAVVELQSTLDDITTLAHQDLATAWNFFDGADAALVRDGMLEVTPAVVDQYGALGAELSASWYVNQDPSSSFEPVLADLPPHEQVEAGVRWAMSPLFGVGEASPLSLLSGSVQRLIYDTSRGTLFASAEREKGARWYRHASATACAWCRVLSLREDYRSRATAMKSHDSCRCIPSVVRPSGTYERPFYVDRWEQEYIDARKEVGGDLTDIVNYMRRTATT